MTATIAAGPTSAATPTDQAAICTVGLRRSFPTGVAIADLSLFVAPGEVLALLGPNGAGKTTTVRLLNGILAPDAGYSRVLGLDPAIDGTEVRRRTGVLTENAGLDDRLTALENLVAVARIRGMTPREGRDRSLTLLDRFGMADRAHERTHGFSTGQRKRVALARALLHDPKVLFLDEPTSGLDPAATREVMGLIHELAHEQGRTVVLATHFLGEAGQVADRLAIVERGELLAFGTPADLAADLWPGLSVSIDLGGQPPPHMIDAVRSLGVAAVSPTSSGLDVVVAERSSIPPVVAALVHQGALVHGATARPPTVEDIYFAVLTRETP